MAGIIRNAMFACNVYLMAAPTAFQPDKRRIFFGFCIYIFKSIRVFAETEAL